MTKQQKTPNSQLAQKLHAAGMHGSKPQNQQRSRAATMKPVPSPANWIEDGVDHLNIWKLAKTKLGRSLSPHSSLQLRHSLFGNFASMSNFWVYLQSVERDDRIRTMSLNDLSLFEKELTTQRVKNFLAIIMDAHYQRIKAHAAVARKLANLAIPLDMYSVNRQTGMPRRSPNFKWMLDGFEEIRLALAENREPDFRFLMEDPENPLFHYELAKFKKPEESIKPPKAPKQPQNDRNHGVQIIVVNNVEASDSLIGIDLLQVEVEGQDNGEVCVKQTAAYCSNVVFLQNGLDMIPGKSYRINLKQTLDIVIPVGVLMFGETEGNESCVSVTADLDQLTIGAQFAKGANVAFEHDIVARFKNIQLKHYLPIEDKPFTEEMKNLSTAFVKGIRNISASMRFVEKEESKDTASSSEEPAQETQVVDQVDEVVVSQQVEVVQEQRV